MCFIKGRSVLDLCPSPLLWQHRPSSQCGASQGCEELIQVSQTWLQSPFCPLGSPELFLLLSSLAEPNLTLQQVSLNIFADAFLGRLGPVGRCMLLRQAGQRQH